MTPAELDRLLEGLAAALPSQLPGLLDHPRFAAGRAALARLGVDTHRAAALAALAPEEAAWIHAALTERWARLGAVSPAPGVYLDGPDDDGLLRLRTEGLDEPIRVSWEGAEALADGRVRPTAAVVEALVDARWRGARCLRTVRLVVRESP